MACGLERHLWYPSSRVVLVPHAALPQAKQGFGCAVPSLQARRCPKMEKVEAVPRCSDDSHPEAPFLWLCNVFADTRCKHSVNWTLVGHPDHGSTKETAHCDLQSDHPHDCLLYLLLNHHVQARASRGSQLLLGVPWHSGGAALVPTRSGR